MSIENIKKRILEIAIKDIEALEKAQWRYDNEDWLDLSFEIAVKIGSVLSKNKALDNFPRNQKELAEAMGVSPQYINKILRGSENLQLETITKIQNILSVKLIEIAKEQTVIFLHQTSFDLKNQKVKFIHNGISYDNQKLVKILDAYNLKTQNIMVSSSSKNINKFTVHS